MFLDKGVNFLSKLNIEHWELVYNVRNLRSGVLFSEECEIKIPDRLLSRCFS